MLRSLELRPDNATASLGLSRLERVRVRWLLEHGQDASEAIKAQEDRAREARTTSPTVALFAAWSLCHAALTRAVQAVAMERDPDASFDAAAADCRKEQSAQPIVRRVEAWIRALQAAALAGRGSSPRAAASQAQALIAASDGPAVAAETHYLGARLALAQAQFAHGREREAALRRAEALATSLRQESPHWALSHLIFARVSLLRGEAREGLAAASQALSLRAGWPEALALKAALEDRLGIVQRAAEDLAAAKAINPRVDRTFLE